MRPLALNLKGFTSFRDEQQMDLADLDLFVLWGPTGSGKSSLLDAMTYALFGKVDRIDETKQLISQGQPRMAVTLDFAVGDGTYRVTRTTTASGSKVLLERKEGDDWESYAEGSDQIREANRQIEELIGLDYDAFTRSVILPQGKFAEFLVGDASKRREILTELLGLELFRRMAHRSNEIAKDARLHADIKQETLDREYAGVDEQALEATAGRVTSTTEMLATVTGLETRLTTIEEQWSAAQRLAEAAGTCAAEAAGFSETAASQAFRLEDHGREIKGAEEALAAAKQSAADADKAAQTASKALANAESKWGNLESLATLKAQTEKLASARSELEAAASSFDNEQAKLKTADGARSTADKELAAASEKLAAATAVSEDAEKSYHEAHKKDHVGALLSGLGPGDPCPVCERPLKSLPAVERKALANAEKAKAKAAAALEAARTEAAGADKKRGMAEAAVTSAQEGVARCEEELAKRKHQLVDIDLAITAAFGKKVPTDPVPTIEEQMATLRDLVDAEAGARSNQQSAMQVVHERELTASQAASRVAEIRAAIAGSSFEGLWRRIKDIAPDLDLPDIAIDRLPEGVGALATFAAESAKELEKLADELRSIAAAHSRSQDDLLAQARAAFPKGVDVERASLKELLAEARRAVTDATTEARRAEDAVADLKRRLESRQKLEQEIESHKSEQAIYSALGKELKGDRIVQFLQAEALTALAAAAAVHLEDLSSGRYRLSYENDKFFVIDAWNGDERRNVKTLSGGETFLASLALALSLSEQVQYLAITERNRLESLFLDEGFGTLDAETLEVVVSAIEQLGGDGRLVGIITHVADLAERLPVKFEITKSPRGSAIRRQDANTLIA